MTLQLGILLALLCAIASNLSFFFKHRGACEAPAVCVRHPWRTAKALYSSRWFTIGMAVGGGAWALHVAAISLVPLSVVLWDFALACLLLPHAALPNRWTDTHSLNSPAWSLLQEYIGNLAYALVLRRLGTRALGVAVAVAAAALLWLLWQRNSIDMGSDWTTWWGAPARMAFSFTMGLWLYRMRERAPKLRLGWAVLSAILVLAFATPLVPQAIPHGNGMFEAAAAMLLFPAIILCGAHSQIGRTEMAVCKFAGRISYPIYILHYPFLLIYMNYALVRKPPAMDICLAGAGSFALVVVVSWLALKLYDEPVRAWLKRPSGQI